MLGKFHSCFSVTSLFFDFSFLTVSMRAIAFLKFLICIDFFSVVPIETCEYNFISSFPASFSLDESSESLSCLSSFAFAGIFCLLLLSLSLRLFFRFFLLLFWRRFCLWLLLLFPFFQKRDLIGKLCFRRHYLYLHPYCPGL